MVLTKTVDSARTSYICARDNTRIEPCQMMTLDTSGETMTFRNEELETMPAEDLKRMQFELLRKEIHTMYDASEFFRKRMQYDELHS